MARWDHCLRHAKFKATQEMRKFGVKHSKIAILVSEKYADESDYRERLMLRGRGTGSDIECPRSLSLFKVRRWIRKINEIGEPFASDRSGKQLKCHNKSPSRRRATRISRDEIQRKMKTWKRWKVGWRAVLLEGLSIALSEHLHGLKVILLGYRDEVLKWKHFKTRCWKIDCYNNISRQIDDALNGGWSIWKFPVNGWGYSQEIAEDE